MKKPLLLGHRGFSGVYPENTPLAFKKVAETGEIKSRHMENEVFVSSFNHVSMQRFKEIAPEIETGLLYESPLQDMGHYLDHCNANNAHPCWHVFEYQPELMELFHSRGMKVNVWTVNDEAAARFMLGLGVDGLIGNYPDLLCRVAGR